MVQLGSRCASIQRVVACAYLNVGVNVRVAAEDIDALELAQLGELLDGSDGDVVAAGHGNALEVVAEGCHGIDGLVVELIAVTGKQGKPR